MSTVSVSDFSAIADADPSSGEGTDNSQKFNDAAEAARSTRSTLVIPPGFYALDETFWIGADRTSGDNVQLLKIIAKGATIFSRAAGKPAVDMTGAQGLDIDGLYINSGPSAVPSIGILAARSRRANGVSAAAGINRFNGVTINGHYSLAGCYDFASEENSWFSPRIAVMAPTCYVSTETNSDFVSSEFTTIEQDQTAQSNNGGQFFRAFFQNRLKDRSFSDGSVMDLRSANNIAVYGGFFDQWSDTHPYVKISADQRGSFQHTFTGILMHGTYDCAVYFAGGLIRDVSYYGNRETGASSSELKAAPGASVTNLVARTSSIDFGGANSDISGTSDISVSTALSVGRVLEGRVQYPSTANVTIAANTTTAEINVLDRDRRVTREQLSGDKHLSFSDSENQLLDPGGEERKVVLPNPVFAPGLYFRIRNSGLANGLRIERHTGSYVDYLAPGAKGFYAPRGAFWDKM